MKKSMQFFAAVVGLSALLSGLAFAYQFNFGALEIQDGTVRDVFVNAAGAVVVSRKGNLN